MELKDFTDEELREELKRRVKERRKSQKHEINYVEFEATICGVDNTSGYKSNGDTKYISFCFWKYQLTDCTLEIANVYHYNYYYNKQGVFRRDNSPQIGDRVKLRYRKTKCGSEFFCLQKAKIVEIIKK